MCRPHCQRWVAWPGRCCGGDCSTVQGGSLLVCDLTRIEQKKPSWAMCGGSLERAVSRSV